MPRKNSARFVSMADVARAAGVSAQTVSRVANGSDAVRPETREHVQAVMDQLGYRPSFAGRSLKFGTYRTIGLVMYSVTGAGNLSRLEGITSTATEHGYAITLVQMPHDRPTSMAEASRRMGELPVDGVIFNLNRLPVDFDEFEPIAGLSSVIITVMEHPRCSSVDSDQEGCGRLVVRYLLSRGHRTVHHIAGPRASVASAFRTHGWRVALEQAGIEAPEPVQGDWSAESGYEAGARLARDPGCTAIFAANDTMALGAVEALRDAGRRVPEDVSVVGVDDSLVGTLPHVELTTVRFDDHAVGKAAFEAALGNGERQHLLIPGKLVERDTVADAPVR